MLKNHNVHVIATYALLILAAPLLLTSIASAQAVNCPTGYSCTPIPQVPGCPVGYLCLPLTTSSGSGAFLNTTNSGGSSSGGYYSGTTGSGYATGGSISSCYVYSRNLSIGSSGQDVAALQSFLIRNGFNIPNVANRLVAAGSFGTNTASALSRYQAVNGIAENGQFGSITRAKLNSLCGNTATATPAVPVAPTTAVSPVYNSPANPVNTPPSTINLTSPTLTAPAVSTLPPTTSFTISSASITLGQAANLTSVTNSPSATLKSAAIDQSTDNVNWTSGTPCGYWNSTTGRDNTHTISCSLLPGAAGTYYFRSRGTDNNGTSAFVYRTLVVQPVAAQAPATAPVAPAVTGTVSVTASPTTVNSGGVVTLTFTYPSNLLGSAKLVINCPDKVWIPDTNGSNLCGLYQEMRDSRTFTFAVMNTSGSVQRVTPNYVVYTSDNPNLANIKSAVISVNPAPTSVLPPLQSETLGASIFDAIQEFIRMR